MIEDAALYEYYTGLEATYGKVLDDVFWQLDQWLRSQDATTQQTYVASRIKKRVKSFDSVLRKSRREGLSEVTEVASAVPIPPNTAVTVGPVNYTLDPAKDLLVAFDISNTPGEGNVRFGALTGADSFIQSATAEAGVQDRTTGYPGIDPNNLFLVEIIEVL